MFRSAIVKLTAVCDIDCTYCYMFNQADKTFTRMPARMPLPTALRLLDRICDYHPQGSAEPFSIVLHGGEPMLWPDASFAALLSHMWIGLRDVLIDYARPASLRLFLLCAVGASLLGTAAWVLWILVRTG